MRKELKKLKREELLELLLEIQEENEKLRQENQELKAKCDERDIILNESGSIAEASLKLTKIFEEAQKAADIYLNSVKKISEITIHENLKKRDDKELEIKKENDTETEEKTKKEIKKKTIKKAFTKTRK